MFADTKIEILNPIDLSVVKTIYADVQPFIKSYPFEDGYTFETTKRAFCDPNGYLSVGSYLQIANQIYFVLDDKRWSDYLELYLYGCKPDFALAVIEK